MTNGSVIETTDQSPERVTTHAETNGSWNPAAALAKLCAAQRTALEGRLTQEEAQRTIGLLH